MGKALYRQYRSASFDEVIGQDHITTTLKNSLKNGAVAHAYLLTGPRGVGKTSVARIFAHQVNDLEYSEGSSHIDIIEIDAASNRRIDEIRELRERAQIAPAAAKYKVYIIDEVHMLTREAFNALLKTLEEPPEHVIFILATTDIHKLPDTIISRCITFTFRPIGIKDLVKHLKHIAEAEKISISDDALHLLAEHGDGSFRDSISLLDQVKSLGSKVDLKEVELVLGIAPGEVVDKILQAVSDGDARMLDSQLSAAYKRGASELKLSKQISAQVREGLVSGKTVVPDGTGLLKDLLDVPSSASPRERLELALLTRLLQKPAVPTQSAPEAIPESKPDVPADTEPPIEEEKAVVLVEEAPAAAHQRTSKVDLTIDKELWESILQKLKTQNNTLYSVARMAQPGFQNDRLTLSFKFPFHFKQVNQSKNKSLLGTIMEELGHKNLQIEVVLSENPAAKPVKKDKALTNINNIFGEGEVLES